MNFPFRRGFVVAALAGLLALPSLALASGSAKISDATRSNQSWTVGYTDPSLTINSNGTISFWQTTVCKGTIVYSDGTFSAIPILSTDKYYRSSFNIRHSNSPGYCSPPGGSPALGSSGGNPGGNNAIGTLISPGTAPHLIGDDGSSLISHDGSSLINNDGGTLKIGDGSYHLMSSGKAGINGSHNPAKFSCTFVYWPGPPSNYYYDHFTVAPRTGAYLCKSAATGTLHLIDGGTWRG